MLVKTTELTSAAPAHAPIPWKALRSWEGYLTPDDEELEERLAERFTRIEAANGQSVVTAHGLFSFSPGDAEFIVKAVNHYDALVAACRLALECATKPVPFAEQKAKADKVIKALSEVLKKVDTNFL